MRSNIQGVQEGKLDQSSTSPPLKKRLAENVGICQICHGEAGTIFSWLVCFSEIRWEIGSLKAGKREIKNWQGEGIDFTIHVSFSVHALLLQAKLTSLLSSSLVYKAGMTLLSRDESSTSVVFIWVIPIKQSFQVFLSCFVLVWFLVLALVLALVCLRFSVLVGKQVPRMDSKASCIPGLHCTTERHSPRPSVILRNRLSQVHSPGVLPQVYSHRTLYSAQAHRCTK